MLGGGRFLPRLGFRSLNGLGRNGRLFRTRLGGLGTGILRGRTLFGRILGGGFLGRFLRKSANLFHDDFLNKITDRHRRIGGGGGSLRSLKFFSFLLLHSGTKVHFL